MTSFAGDIRPAMAEEDAERLLARLLEAREIFGGALSIPRGEVVGMLQAAVAVGGRLEFAALGEHRACRVCGCTETNACEGGCFWVRPGLCSACAPEMTNERPGGLLA